MQNIVSIKRGEHSYHFKYEVNQDEPVVVQTLTTMLADGRLNCFDTALLRRDMEIAQEAVNAGRIIKIQDSKEETAGA